MKKKILFGLQLITVLIISTAPALVAAASVQLSWQGNSESDLQGYNVYYGTQSRVYGPPIAVNNSETFVLDGLADSTVYYFAISATDNSGNESGYSSEVTVETASSQGGTTVDTVAPGIQITSPTSADVFETEQSTIAIAGQASDDNGIANVTWETNQGKSGTASGLTSWTADNIVLSEGQNLVTVHAFDTSGNETVDQLTVQYTPVDTVAPQVEFDAPFPTDSSASIETTEPLLSLSGSATDNREVVEVNWSINGTPGGTAVGTANWSVEDIALSAGTNIITMVAKDASGNQSSDAIAVYYNVNVDLVSSVKAASGRKYEIQDHLSSGNRVYIDRSYTYGNLPQEMRSAVYIMSANNDKTTTGSSFLSFHVSRPVTVYVAHDDRITAKPAWMNGFVDTGLDLSSDVSMSLFRQSYPAGTVTLGGNGGTSRSSMYTVVVSENAVTELPPLKVTNLSADSGESYQVQDNLSDGKRVYVDRSYLYENLPGQMQGNTYIMPANDDKISNGDHLLSFQVNRPVTVYVAHDDRIVSKPAWLDQFADTGFDLKSDVPMSIFARRYAAGTVDLGGNGGSSDTSMYTVAIGD